MRSCAGLSHVATLVIACTTIVDRFQGQPADRRVHSSQVLRVQHLKVSCPAKEAPRFYVCPCYLSTISSNRISASQLASSLQARVTN